MATVLLIAAGPGTRWDGYLGIPKHLAPYNGTTMLGRLVSQFREHDVTVVGPPGDSRYDIEGSKLVTPETRPTDANKFLSSADLWSTTGRTIIVYGDIFLTDEGAETIAEGEPDDWTLYARFDRSPVLGRAARRECFAVTFLPEHHSRYQVALESVEQLQLNGTIPRSGGWEAFKWMNGSRGAEVMMWRGKYKFWKRPTREGLAHLHQINDWSTDFDFPEDYQRWAKRRQRAGLPV